MMPPVSEEAATEECIDRAIGPRWKAAGKFFRDGDTGETVFVRAVTWGPFPPGGEPDPDTELRRVRDELGANALRLYEIPDRAFLDRCAGLGLRVFLTFPWTHHVDFIADRRLFHEERERFRRTVAGFRGHPAIAGWFVANEIAAPLVRWMGPRKVNAALEALITTGREADPEALFSYANYPSTEYLCPRGQDFIAFNLYLEDRDACARYLRRLQQQAGDLPLLIAEFGLDSRGHDEARQAEVLGWHVEETARAGAAGTTLFAWSDLWYRGGETITGWDFGLTRRDGSAKPAMARVAAAWRDWQSPVDSLDGFPRPRMSIVVCTYRGARLLRPCLESFRHLRYPDFEVIVVNDGGDAGVEAIATGFPEVRLLTLEPHGGLSAARNLGAREATGGIIVYTDDDCEADPDWLTWLALAFARDDLAAAGGPNIPPPPTGRTRAIVAAAPGGPAHVLLDDIEAEHLPGCNLAVRREILEEIGGFDERFRTAGDDVDFCWRLLDAGHRIGFHPAAMVWHHRRFTVKGYLKQQLGYGRAEAMLIPLHPGRFGLRGGARWRGRVYLESPAARLLTSSARIYHGLRGHAPFQALYGDGSSHSPAALTLDWSWVAVGLVLALLGIGFGLWITGIAGLAMLIASAGRALIHARRASIPSIHDGMSARLGVAALTLVQGPMRSFRRSLGLLSRGSRDDSLPPPVIEDELADTVAPPLPGRSLRLPFLTRTRCYWSGSGVGRDDLLSALETACRESGWGVEVPENEGDQDLVIIPSPGDWRYRLASVTEYHGNQGCLTRLRISPAWQYHPLAIPRMSSSWPGIRSTIDDTASRLGMTRA